MMRLTVVRKNIDDKQERIANVEGAAWHVGTGFSWWKAEKLGLGSVHEWTSLHDKLTKVVQAIRDGAL